MKIFEKFREFIFHESKIGIDDEDGQYKSIRSVIGPKQERCVIEGDGDVVKNNLSKIMALINKYDSANRMQFYPVTGKIVGAFKSYAIKKIAKDLKSIDSSIRIYVKNLNVR